MDAENKGIDMPKIIAVLISLLEDQENVKITYTVEPAGKTKTA